MLIREKKHKSKNSEAYRPLSTNIQFLKIDEELRTSGLRRMQLKERRDVD